jgi:hypothetical protein
VHPLREHHATLTISVYAGVYVLVAQENGRCVYHRFGDDFYRGHGLKSGDTLSDDVEEQHTWFSTFRLLDQGPQSSTPCGLFAVKPGQLAVADTLVEKVAPEPQRQRASIQLEYEASGALVEAASITALQKISLEKQERDELANQLQGVSGPQISMLS